MFDSFGSPSESGKTIPNIVVSKPEEFWSRAVGMVFANCSVIEMIDHSKGLRNVKKHIYRQKASGAFAAMTTISVASVGLMSYLQMSNTIESDAIAKVVAVEESMEQSLD